MKLLYAFPEPLPLPRARGMQVVNTVEALAAAGLEVVVAHVPAEDPAVRDPFAFYEVPRRDGVRSAAIARNLAWPLSRVHSNRVFMARLATLIEAENPDAAFVRHIKIAVLIRKRFPALPIVYEAHEVFADTAAADRRSAVESSERAALAAVDAVVANSQGTAIRLKERYGVREVTVVPNGVERPASMPVKDWGRVAEDIVYAGSLFPWKGVTDLVDAAAALPGCGITIAGGDANEIAGLRARLKPDGARVAFVGRIDHGRVRALLESSCIAVLPNRADAESAFTSPLKLFEYMAAGCAVVASDLPAIREIVSEGEAVFATPGDPGSLAAAIRSLAADAGRARRLGEALYAKSADHTWQARGRKLAEVIAALRPRP